MTAGNHSRKEYSPFRKELAISVLVLVISVLIMSFIANGMIVYQMLQTQYRVNLDASCTKVIQSIEYQDIVYLSIEKQLEQRLEPALKAFEEAFKKAGPNSEVDFTLLQARFGKDIDFFIINRDSIIERGTLIKDIGLNLAKYPRMAKFLDYVRQSEDICSERATLSRNDGIKKFVYKQAPDKKHILEAGISLTNSEHILAGLDFQDMNQILSKSDELIQSVSIYDYSGKSYTANLNGFYPRLKGKRLLTLNKAVATKERQSMNEGAYVYEYRVVPQKDSVEGGYAGKVVEVVLDTSKSSTIWQTTFWAHSAVLLISIILAVAGSIILAGKIARPVLRLTDSVQNIAAGDLLMPVTVAANNEVGILADSVEQMRCKLAQLLNDVNRKNEELAQAYEMTIKAFFKALVHREKSTARHSLEVNKIAITIGRQLQLSEEDMHYLEWGTLLHDIGKLAVSDVILLKPGSLNPEERNAIRQHPVVGYEMLQDNEYLKPVAEISLCHHEHYDGSGYPYGLSGTDIPLLARICAVADAFEAMIADRPYRKGRTVDAAVEELLQCCGTQFDPVVIDAFLRVDYAAIIDENHKAS